MPNFTTVTTGTDIFDVAHEAIALVGRPGPNGLANIKLRGGFDDIAVTTSSLAELRRDLGLKLERPDSAPAEFVEKVAARPSTDALSLGGNRPSAQSLVVHYRASGVAYPGVLTEKELAADAGRASVQLDRPVCCRAELANAIDSRPCPIIEITRNGGTLWCDTAGIEQQVRIDAARGRKSPATAVPNRLVWRINSTGGLSPDHDFAVFSILVEVGRMWRRAWTASKPSSKQTGRAG
jgi:hypothetical protein